jgi:hypothetical protein
MILHQSGQRRGLRIISSAFTDQQESLGLELLQELVHTSGRPMPGTAVMLFQAFKFISTITSMRNWFRDEQIKVSEIGK